MTALIESPGPDLDRQTRPLIIGHRGASGEAPENTLVAFELALRQGADGIEFDVRLSAEGVPVVIHDAWLDRTTNGRGRVRDHSFAMLRQFDAGSWFNRRHPALARVRYAGIKIPTLAEVLAWVKRRNCLAYLEIKQARPAYCQIEEKVLAEIHRQQAASQMTVISFSFPTLRRLRRLDSQIAVGIDCMRPMLAIRRAESVRASCVLPHWAFTSRSFLARARRAGIKVLVWDLDDARGMRRKTEDGVDGIVTRYPALLSEIIREAGVGRADRLLPEDSNVSS